MQAEKILPEEGENCVKNASELRLFGFIFFFLNFRTIRRIYEGRGNNTIYTPACYIRLHVVYTDLYNNNVPGLVWYDSLLDLLGCPAQPGQERI